MTSYTLDTSLDVILVLVRFIGPTAEIERRCALDTGASVTSISDETARLIGYDPHGDTVEGIASLVSAEGMQNVPVLRLAAVEALGKRCENLLAVCQNLPASAEVDGVLGLNFFENTRLTLDFKARRITLE